MTRRHSLSLGVACILVIAATALSAAAPTPTATPGGSNQVGGVSGALGQELWNGVVRFKLVELRDATPVDHPESVVPLANQKVMVVTAIIKNGTSGQWGELVSYTLADKDGVTFVIPGNFFRPVALNIQQAAAARQRALFPVDKNFVPVKLIFACTSCSASKFKAFRVSIPPPAAP
jgi:hypothetical protein